MTASSRNRSPGERPEGVRLQSAGTCAAATGPGAPASAAARVTVTVQVFAATSPLAGVTVTVTSVSPSASATWWPSTHGSASSGTTETEPATADALTVACLSCAGAAAA